MNKIENSKIMLVLSILLIFLVIGSVSASDKTANETISTPTDDGVDALTESVSVDEKVSAADTNDLVANDANNSNQKISSNNNDLLSDNIKTFTDLKNEINAGANKTIVLSGTYYKYDASIDDRNIIHILNSSIDGKGAIIDGGDARRAFGLNGQSNLIIKNINFINCYQDVNSHDNSGSAINIQNCINITIENCTFNNTRNKDTIGGAILLTYANYTNIVNCNFTNIVNGHSGGAIDFYQANRNFFNNIEFCRFENVHGGNGGAIEYYTTNSTIKNCTFNLCFADKNPGCIGGAVALFSGCPNNNITGCIFTNCNAVDNGGAVAIKDGVNMLLSDCIFDNCSAKNGGAVHSLSTDSTIANSTFTNNKATNSAGAIYFNARNGAIKYSNFDNNSANVSGGAIYSNAEGSKVSYSNFTNNSAPNGENFYATKGIEFEGLIFPSLWLTNNNTQKSILDGYGTSRDMPASWDDADQILEFLDKSGSKTVIYLVGTIDSLPEKVLSRSNLEIIGYDPVNNPAGAVIDMSNWNHRAFTTNAEHITFRNIKFINANNFTGNGGVILTNAMLTNVVNCTFSDINITGNGGAIYANSVGCSVENSTFKNNNVTGNGASVYVNDRGFILSGCTFDSNNAVGNGTIYVNQKEGANILTSDFQNNHAYEGACIYIKGHVFYKQQNNTFTGSSIDNTQQPDRLNISDFEARKMMGHVYVNLTGTNTSEGTINNPMDLHTAFEAVDSNGIITFVDKTDKAIYYYSIYDSVPLTKQGIIFDGQLGVTTFVNIGFMTTQFSSGSKIYNLTFTNYTNTAIICTGSNNYAINCIFIDNKATCIINSGKNNRAINCTFTNNTVSNRVSCLEVQADGFTNITDCRFINNTGSSAVSVSGSASINNCNLTDNTGCVLIVRDATGDVTVTDSKFENNHNNGFAGAVYNTNSTLNIIKTNFTGNNATYGGAVYNNGTLTIKDESSFIGNNATYGGAIYNDAALTVSGSIFTGNNATYGGAVFSNGNLTVSSSIFTGNNATLGGALFLNSTKNNITSVLFTGNHAVNGSAIYVNRTGDITLRNDTFRDNVASTRGTVFFAQDTSIETNTIGDDLIFTNNIPADDRFVFADNVDFTANVLYVSVGGVGDGLTSDNRANLTDALEHAAEDAIIYLEKDVYTFNALKFTANQVTIIGNGSTVKGNKYLFILQVFK